VGFGLSFSVLCPRSHGFATLIAIGWQSRGHPPKLIWLGPSRHAFIYQFYFIVALSHELCVTFSPPHLILLVDAPLCGP